MAKNMAAIVAHHRKILEGHHDVSRAPLESVQIVILADIAGMTEATLKKARKKK